MNKRDNETRKTYEKESPAENLPRRDGADGPALPLQRTSAPAISLEERAYGSYVHFCTSLGQTHMSFEVWRVADEALHGDHTPEERRKLLAEILPK